MAEVTLDLRGTPKAAAYQELAVHTAAVLEAIDDHVAAMATMSALLHHGFGHLWTGFYRVVAPGLLRVGPYQGTLGCLEIAVGRGVCGTAAAERRTVVVRDVNAFPGHITCDARSRSEIVVPVFDHAGALIAVLDIDSDRIGAFDDDDRDGLELLVSWFARSSTLDPGSRQSYLIPPSGSAPEAPAMTTGYSDRINHALAFAAKHHDRQVRKGTRLPYITHPANVAIILTRYDQDEETVVAGILHDVIEDCVREHYTREMLERRIADKFGTAVLDSVLAVTKRSVDDEDVELSKEEQKQDYLARLGSADERALWVCAADKLHNANCVLADLKRTIDPDSVWGRFNGGKEATIRWYRSVYERLQELGFRAEIMRELQQAVLALEHERESVGAD